MIAALAASAALATAAVWYLLPYASRLVAERRLAAQCRAARAIVLSFDDGPGAGVTPALLDLLEREGVRATFFVLGDRAARHPDIVRRALAEGHEIGSHTATHPNAWKTGPHRWARDLAKGARRVDALGGTGRFVRPPYGKLTFGGWILGAMRGISWAWWTVDTRDARSPRAVGEVLREIAGKGGGVVLMHDFDRPGSDGRDARAAGMLQLTAGIVRFARAEGYRLVTLGELGGASGQSGQADRGPRPSRSPDPARVCTGGAR